MHTFYAVSKDDDGKETVEAQVFVSDESGEITEVRTGPQVAWMMARGYKGVVRPGDHPPADLGAASAPSSWWRCCRFLRPRRLLSLRTLDLLVLLSFSVSLVWFNRRARSSPRCRSSTRR